MDIQGKVIAALPEKTGVSAKGEWKVQEYVIETHEAYPHKMVFSVFGADRIARFNVQVGQEVMVSFDIDAHEYQGRWFNNIRAWRVVAASENAVPPVVDAAPITPATDIPAPTADVAPASEDKVDDLPF